MLYRIVFIVVFFASAISGCSKSTPPQNLPPIPTLSRNAPEDKPFDFDRKQDKAAKAAFDAEVAPLIEKARKTYPEAKQRYLAGLPKDHHFYAVTVLKDRIGSTEQVFISVAKIEGNQITGRIASDIRAVKGYHQGDPYAFSEDELVDWLITQPDGTEEGNVVGKFLDEWQLKRNRK